MPGFIDFKELAESVDIAEVATWQGVTLKPSHKELRANCPACDSDDPRTLCIYPATNSFRCFAANKSGDAIALFAHLNGVGMYPAAKALQQHFQGATARSTAPQEPLRRETTRPSKSEPSFDPQEYADKLKFTDEVAALGLSEDEAKELQVGWSARGFHRNVVVAPLRWPNGEIAAFIPIPPGTKLPKLTKASNVVKLRRA